MENNPECGGIKAIARDPHTIFVYWDADMIGSDKLSGRPGANVRAVIAWSLKLYCCDTKDVLMQEVDPASGKHYFHGLHSGYTYQIRLCQVDTMGDAHCFLQCDEVVLPRSGFSSTHDPEWAVSKQDLVEIMGKEFFGAGSSDRFMSACEE